MNPVSFALDMSNQARSYRNWQGRIRRESRKDEFCMLWWFCLSAAKRNTVLQVLNSSLVVKFNQQKLYLGDYKTMPILMGHFYVKFELACGVWHMKGHSRTQSRGGQEERRRDEKARARGLLAKIFATWEYIKRIITGYFYFMILFRTKERELISEIG